MRVILGLITFFCLFEACGAEEPIQLPAQIQIASTVSDGRYSIPEICRAAQTNNIKAVFITDRDLMRWEYGVWPLRRIIKKTVQQGSIFNYGIEHYLDDVKKERLRHPGLLIIPGAESAPFYYWRGSPLGKGLQMNDWHKHMLVLGLEQAEDYRYLPVIGNYPGLRLPFNAAIVSGLFFRIGILLGGIALLFKREFNYKDSSGRNLGPHSPWLRAIGILLIITGIVFSADSYPFYRIKFDQYHGEQGIKPYQGLIDYANQRGALVFWAHPEAEFIGSRDNVRLRTQEYTADLLNTVDYTGFAVFYEGFKKFGKPQGLWDDVLRDYCEGKRNHPVWAIAGANLESGSSLDSLMKDTRTMLLVSRVEIKEALNALKRGRAYAAMGRYSSLFTLDTFKVKDQALKLTGTMGDELAIAGSPIIEIAGGFLNAQPKKLNVKLIKNGNVIKNFEVPASFHIFYQDSSLKITGKNYYRIEIDSEGLTVVTNPIFVTEGSV